MAANHSGDDSDFSDWDDQIMAQIEHSERQPRCTKCHKGFTLPKDARRHERTCVGPNITCQTCGRKFNCPECMRKHQEKCRRCDTCEKTFTDPERMAKHRCRKQTAKRKRSPSPSEARRPIKCRQCRERFQTRGEVYRHRMTAHREPEVPIGDPEELLEHDDPDLVREFEANRAHIYRPHHVDSNPAVYNFPTTDLKGGMAEMKDRIQTVFHKESQAFKINISLGFILRHVTDGRYRYFIPHQNCPLLDYHMSVSSISDLQQVYKELAKANIRDYTYPDRTSTSWKLAFVCNINIFIYRTTTAYRRRHCA